jgi:hypothetical protein
MIHERLDPPFMVLVGFLQSPMSSADFVDLSSLVLPLLVAVLGYIDPHRAQPVG